MYFSLHILSNDAEIDQQLRDQFMDILKRHTDPVRWRDDRAFRLKFFFGWIRCTEPKTEREIFPVQEFLDDLSDLVKNIPPIPYSMSHAIIVEDVVAGRLIRLVPDETAIQSLEGLSQRLCASKLGAHIEFEDGFLPSAGLHWVKRNDEAEPIMEAINALQFEISGEVNQIEVFKVDRERAVVLKTFDLAK